MIRNEISTSEPLRILYIGHAGEGSNACSLYKGFMDAQNRVFLVDTKIFYSIRKYSVRNLIIHLFPKFYIFCASKLIGLTIAFRVRINQPDILFVFKGDFVSSKTLERIRIPKFHYHPDDSSNPDNRTFIFDQAEKFYDLHITSKSHNLDEIYLRTGKPVRFVWYAYDPEWHFRSPNFDFRNRKYVLGLIGNYRFSRANLITRIASVYGHSFAIAGIRWDKIKLLRNKVTLLGPKYGRSYSDFIAEAPIQLGVLNSENRDQHTARSFEVPACGGLLIAEDTLEHRVLFEQQNGALFFRNENHLFELLEWVERNPDEAHNIAQNGYDLITKGKNTWKDRAILISAFYQELFAQ